MATKKMVELLRQLVAGQTETNRRLDVLHDDVFDLRGEVHAFKEETRTALSDLDRRVEKLTDRIEAVVLDRQREDLAARVARLEAEVFRPAAE